MPNVDEQPIATNEEVAQQPRAGVYHVFFSGGNAALKPLEPRRKPAVRVPSRQQLRFEAEVTAFFDAERTQRLHAAGLLHRGGVVLHGRSGCGKTSTVATVFTQCVEAGAMVLLNPAPEPLPELITEMRAQHSALPVVAVYDGMWSLRELMDEPLVRTIRRKLNPLLEIDRLLLIVVIDLGAVPDSLAEPDIVQCVVEFGTWSRSARSRLIAEHYPQLSADERRFALELAEGGSQLLLHEACRLLLMGDEPDEVRDRIDDLRNVRAVTAQDLMRNGAGSDDGTTD